MPEQANGWAGAFSVPRELKLADDGTLRMLPVEELQQLRANHRHVDRMLLAADTELIISNLRGDVLELIAVFKTNPSIPAGEFGLKLRCSDDGKEYTEVAFEPRERKLKVDRTFSGEGNGGTCEAYLANAADGLVRLHLFLDRSSVELFANGGEKTMTNRIYPKADSLGIKVFTRVCEAELESLEVWDLNLKR
ncbi:GH32 C-terminal domain-containing protein [Paenibacillus hexagrammi]